MTFDAVYGSRPESLPSSMVHLVRTPSGREWVARDGVKLLDAKAHSAIERAVFGEYRRHSDGTIDWEKFDPGAVILSLSASAQALRDSVEALAEGARLFTFLWDSIAVPSVTVGREIALSLATVAVEKFAEFWIVTAPLPMLFEFSSLKDRLVVARL
jgi:hypothetical protein